ncbi:MAG: hypothetical protein CMJ76_01730 [Planctomycetaceae bacterium]|nr:hypothetical protein [Planctomycetaceae bacterium]|tara:strand:+ start:1022 stop:1705 length:684 start_codon:yes stop_codon:yes gene_type:complete
MDAPIHCRSDAYWTFCHEIEDLESSQGLLNAVVAVAMHFVPNTEVHSVQNEIEEIAERILLRVPSGYPRALAAHLHQVLFDDLGFHGDTNNYFNPRNSFLPHVLRSKQGLPITLTIIYKLVAERIGLQVDGINTPGHFLARLHVEDDSMIIDPFFRGNVLNAEEVADRIAMTTGQCDVVPIDQLPTATNRQWIARVLANLIHIYSMQGCPQSIAAMSELYDVLKVTY